MVSCEAGVPIFSTGISQWLGPSKNLNESSAEPYPTLCFLRLNEDKRVGL